MTLKDFDYSCSLGYKRHIVSKRKDVEVMNAAGVLKLHDFILSSISLSRKNIGSKTFLRSLLVCKVLMLSDFFKFQNYRDVSAAISHIVLIFLLNTS